MKTLLSNKGMQLFLWLIALHSFIVGILLIILPPDIMKLFGFNLINERFFQVQAGVFHIVMVVAYLMAAKNPGKRQIMVKYSYIVKFMATIFLITYTLFIQGLITLFLSAIADFSMALILYYFNKYLLTNDLYKNN